MATWVGCKLIKEGCMVAFDMEDWYSNDLLPEDQQSRPLKLLRSIERFALANGVFTFTTSDAMARHMTQYYDVPRPLILYNVFPASERAKIDKKVKDRQDVSKISLIWFSQTIGPGRGLEYLIEALRLVSTPIELHLRGNCHPEYRKLLQINLPKEVGHTLYIHELVPNEEILSRLCEHDIGLALEPKTPLNKDLTISNKIFHYLLAGIPVIASDTLGQMEVAEKAPEAVFIFKNTAIEELACKINLLVGNRALLVEAKGKALEAASNIFCWEKQEAIIIEAVKKIDNSNKKKM
jgi:glycosyltransferase involved in cell wall biosynthesis